MTNAKYMHSHFDVESATNLLKRSQTAVEHGFMTDWCLTPTLAIFQLYRGETKNYINLRHLHGP